MRPRCYAIHPRGGDFPARCSLARDHDGQHKSDWIVSTPSGYINATAETWEDAHVKEQIA